MEMEYIIEQVAETRWFYTFAKPNGKGETLVLELSKCINLNAEKDKKSLPYLWYKAGYTNRILKTYWGIDTYVRDTEGGCYGRYNPQHKISEDAKRPVINFDWMFEATKENKQRLIEEVYRLFSSATGKTATEEKIDEITRFAKNRNVALLTEIPEGWKDVGGMTAPIGATWISNMAPFKSGKRKTALLILG